MDRPRHRAEKSAKEFLRRHPNSFHQATFQCCQHYPCILLTVCGFSKQGVNLYRGVYLDA